MQDELFKRFLQLLALFLVAGLVLVSFSVFQVLFIALEELL